MNFDQAESKLRELLEKDKDKNEAIHTLEVVLQYIIENDHQTFLGLHEDLNKFKKRVQLIDQLKLTSVISAYDLFIQHITLTEHMSKDDWKSYIILRGRKFLEEKKKARQRIVAISKTLGLRGNILVHSYSRVLSSIIRSLNRLDTTLFITQSMPDSSGELMKREMEREGFKCYLILDSSIGRVMEKIDVVLLGAEMVYQNGGILNKVGTFTISLCGKALNKPIYVAAESFKFSKEIILNNRHMSNNRCIHRNKKIEEYKKNLKNSLSSEEEQSNSFLSDYLLDYSPPNLLTYFISDLGVLSPDAVCDVVLNLYT